MTLRLILTRHAKSSWDTPTLQDPDRPLNDRGRASAAALGAWMAAEGHVPDLVLSSDARRTRETWDGIAPALGAAPRIVWTPDLYHAGPGTILKSLRRAGDARIVLLLGHNPGIAQFAGAIVTAPPAHPRFDDYPTGATLIAAFDLPDWNDLRPGLGRTLDFTTPRDLIGA